MQNFYFVPIQVSRLRLRHLRHRRGGRRLPGEQASRHRRQAGNENID